MSSLIVQLDLWIEMQKRAGKGQRALTKENIKQKKRLIGLDDYSIADSPTCVKGILFLGQHQYQQADEKE